MFGDYVYKKFSDQYSDRILLIDEDHLDNVTNYSSTFKSHGFNVIYYKNDLDFRIFYGDKLNSGDRIAIIAEPEKYIPYDVRRMVKTYDVSFASLFPQLNTQVLKDKSKLDYDMLSIACCEDYDNYESRQATEDFFRQKVYSKKTGCCYVSQLLEKCSIQLDNYTSYRDWYAIAEMKARIDILAMQYGITVDTNYINFKFQKYILNEFDKLSGNMDDETPVLVSKAMDYMHGCSKKFIIIVMDGMSEFDWQIISRSFDDIRYRKSSLFAMIPTVTCISRQCLLSNKYPVKLVEPWHQNNEEKEFTDCARNMGFSDNQISYRHGYDSDFGALIRCGAVVINDVDEMVHGQKQGRLGMYNDISILSNQHKLADMTRRFLLEGFDVYISSDHGNTSCTGIGRLMGTGVEIETKSGRMVVLRNFADKQNLIKKHGLIEYPKYYLPKEFDYLICDAKDSFDIRGNDVMSHGGITIDEVVVPFIKIRSEENNG